jgi:hypothetical protein
MRCRYELLGQDALGRCPECGMAVASSLAMRAEHLQHGEAALRRPSMVATALVTGSLAVLACVVLQVAAPMLAAIDALRGQTSLLQGQVRLWGWMGSLAMILTALVTLATASSGREPALRAELGRWRAWMLIGVAAWAAALLATIALQWRIVHLPDPLRASLPWIGAAIQLPGMTCALAGFHALLAIVGRRSQALLEARAARQSVSLLNTVAALAVVFAIAAPMLHRLEQDWMAGLMMAAAAGTAALLIFGAAYLVANACWVARALMLPKPRVEAFLDQP